jgi:hypothetical protein
MQKKMRFCSISTGRPAWMGWGLADASDGRCPAAHYFGWLPQRQEVRPGPSTSTGGVTVRFFLLGLAWVAAAALASIALLVACWLLRPNGARVDASLDLEHWAAVSDGMHNSSTDLTR